LSLAAGHYEVEAWTDAGQRARAELLVGAGAAGSLRLRLV
jgi:hypothetical protein